MVQFAVALLSALGAVNWFLADQFNFDLLVDGLGLANSELTLVYAALAVAATVLVYNEAVWKGFIEG